MFEGIFVPDEVRAAVSDASWLEALLAAERALAAAEARCGVIPTEAAAAIARACRAELYDVEELARGGRAVGNPVEPLVRALREEAGEAASWVHWGATSQDVLDTAAMLVTRRALDLVLVELDGTAERCAELADAYRSTPMAGRTLLQHAVPTTFGAKAAGWLVAVCEVRRRLSEIRETRLAVQLGGAAGTLAPLAERGPEVLRAFAAELDLAEPVVPWHTNRTRVAEIGAALAVAAGVAGKIALDVTLLAQTEVAEVIVREGGASSTMPQKRNPVGSVLAGACARQVQAYASVLTGALAQEHERAGGAWHAEWRALTGALALTGGAAAAVRHELDGIEVDTERMRRNLDATNGAIMAEGVAFALAEQVGRREAQELVRTAVSTGRPLRDELGDRVPETAFDPVSHLGSAEAFVERALAYYRETA